MSAPAFDDNPFNEEAPLNPNSEEGMLLPPSQTNLEGLSILEKHRSGYISDVDRKTMCDQLGLFV